MLLQVGDVFVHIFWALFGRMRLCVYSSAHLECFRIMLCIELLICYFVSTLGIHSYHYVPTVVLLCYYCCYYFNTHWG